MKLGMKKCKCMRSSKEASPDCPDCFGKGKVPYDILHPEVMAVTKAERNAILHLISDKIKDQVLMVALEKGRVASEDPDSGQRSSPGGSRNGGKGASQKQIDLIDKFLRNKNVTPQMKADFEKDREGLTMPKASKWIQYLKDIAEGKEKKEQENMPL